MRLFEWKSEYSTKIEELDIHHQELFKIFNMICDDYMKADSANCIGLKIDELLAFTDYHFIVEEQYMRDKGYKNINSHILIHRTFTDRIAALKLIDNRNESDISKELLDYFGNWLIHHVMEEHKLFDELYQYQSL